MSCELCITGWREGQQKVVGRDPALPLTFPPSLALRVLTVRAKAIAAGRRNEFWLIAAFALNRPHRAGRAAAIAQGREGLKRLEAQPVTKWRQEVRFEFGDDRAEADHRGRPLGQR